MTLPAIIFVLVQTGAAADGGVSSITQVIANLKHYRPIIVTDRDGPRVKEWRRAGIETHIVSQSMSRSGLRDPLGVAQSYWRYARKLREIVRSSGAKIIHANDPAAMQLAIVPAKLTGAKLAFNLRGTFDPKELPSGRKYRTLFRAADHVFFLSADMRRRWCEYLGMEPRSESVTYSPVDQDRFRPATDKVEAEKVVLVSALIRPLKGQLEFLENVAPELAKSGVATWFAGDFDPSSDPYMAACARAAAPLGDKVEFLGYRTDIPELMARSTVVAVTSYHEGLVRAMIEAMSCGRPVVSFDICSAREVLERESDGAGVVVAAGDYAAMAAALLRYCADLGLAAAAGGKGVVSAKRLFATSEVARRYEAGYAALESPPGAATDCVAKGGSTRG